MFRKTLFWIHLVTGLLAGLIIFLKCATGVVLVLEKPVVAWIDRDARRVSPSPAAEARRLSLDALTSKLREARPDARPSAVTIDADPAATVQFRVGREEIVYVDPYTGAVLPSRAASAQQFFRKTVEVHRWFALDGEARQVAKQVGGAANVIFLLLAITGLYLWWPRHWSWRGFRAIAVFNLRLAGKARDFNWHNSIGLWTAPVLIVITLTALPISYRWAGDLIPRLTGDPIEAPRGEGGERRGPSEGMSRRGAEAGQQKGAAERPSAREGESQGQRGGARTSERSGERAAAAAGQQPLPNLDKLFTLAAQAVPQWENITLRLGGAPGRGGPGGRGGSGGGGLSAQVREPSTWPRTASITLNFDATAGTITGREVFGDQSAARQIRGWTRFLHTGEALGWWGQALAGLACLGGLFLVYTGIALSWRRFFRRKAA